MVIPSLNFRSKIRAARSRTQSPTIETFERRMLLASSGILQGIVSLDGTSQGLPGASILLHKLDSPSIPNQTTTTDASGAYLFQSLPGGQYQITETPPSGYVNSTTNQPINSPLTPIVSQTPSTIVVQLSDFSQLQISYPSRNKETLTLTSNGTTQQGLVGQLNITVTEPDVNFTTSLFPSFCTDFYRNIFTGDTNLPYSAEPLSAGLANDPLVKNPQNAGEIAYLYNHFGSTFSTDPNQVPVAEVTGFQLAIWELEYETSGTNDVLKDSFFAQGLTINTDEYKDAQNFLFLAHGKNELALYLNGLPTPPTPNRPGGSQGLIAPESLDFTDLPAAQLDGFVYVDANNNGVKDSGEAPIPGTTVTLSGTNDLGAITPIVTTTDATGAYSFANLRPGTYTVTETQPAGYLQGTNAVGTVSGTTDGQLGPGVDVISKIVLASGNDGVNYNFGELLNPLPGPTASSIGGTVFSDCNNDGIQQASETGIPGVTITLTGVDTTGTPVHLVTTTNSQGSYDFSLVNPGTYMIIEAATPAYLEGKNTAGTAGGTVLGDVISGITLSAGANASGYNFAELTPSVLSGVVYYDLNHNGVMDSVDFGIAHVTVTLNGTDDLGQSIHMTTVTNDEGMYSFADLRPGTYDIIRTQPAIFRGYKNTVGSLGGTVNKDSITAITVPACATGVDYLFGELQQPQCRLRDLAISVGNLFYHFERTYQSDPVGFTKQYPNLAPSIAAGQVPWGKAPFPSAQVASYWVPKLGTKPIKIFPVKGIKSNPLVSPTSGHSAVLKLAHAQTSSFKPVSVHTPSIKPTLLQRIVRK